MSMCRMRMVLYVIYFSFLREKRERSVQVKPPVEEDSPSTDSDDIASVKDSVEPGTTCKKEALAGDDDAEIDSEEKTLIFNP